MKAGLGSPASRLFAALVAASAVFLVVFACALRQPWLGTRLVWDEGSGGARVLASEGPAQAIPEGSVIASIQPAGEAARRMQIEGADLTLEPDSDLPTYRAYARFLRRQDQLANIQAAPRVELIERNGAVHRVLPHARRPLGSLPSDFWVQVAVGFFAWLISAGVWAFRPHERSARYLLLTGFSTLIFAPFAAVYSTRELAIPFVPLIWLKDLNHFGGIVYAASMVALL